MASQALAAQKFSVDAAGRRHILDGDSRGGGHRFCAGKGRSEFPQTWSDDTIIDAIEDVANDPASPQVPAKGGRIMLYGTRNGVLIIVIVDPVTGELVTGYPKWTGRP
jgi:Bacterial EndoU nuclease